MNIIITIPIFTDEETESHRKFTQGHTAYKCQSQVFNLGGLALEAGNMVSPSFFFF